MELPASYLQKFKVKKRKSNKEISLAWEIALWTKCHVSIPLKFLKQKRFEDILALFNYMKNEGISEKKYFIGACVKMENKIGYKKDGKQLKLLKK